ncbi:DUF971 domain-containing protein [Lichenifustis flavocetrariae]|uniref:DUF971 domain-containing protein n=1 Tax=Lichenifustis flavocetrariae TaxID=2949735 RepID=A0AA41YXT8_9HYPH|nr:DUF971 domain-containing protein [Lichenifustis flavocetrariae]MCW6510544.1 DUF971 domain-containing protein [Lichenifustis flavocetrariae]
MTQESTEVWPTELRVRDGGTRLAVTFDSGRSFDLPAEYLRVESPSAEVQGHSAAEKKTVAGKRQVRIAAATPVGHYAVKLTFDDGHDSGLFTWTYLFELGQEHDQRWQTYLAALAARGLGR